ncbi:unnamed protein product [Rotaria socialis]
MSHEIKDLTSIPTSVLETDLIQQVQRRSFSHWSHRAIPSSAQMIEAGFFNCNVGDRVICIYCNLICQQWTPHKDDPCEVHKKLSPNCPYVKSKLMRPAVSPINVGDGKSTVNTSDIPSRTASNLGPLRSNDTVFTDSCNPAYSEIPKRHASYATWPIEDLPPVDDLVRAGFFYTGTKSIVTCFYCNGSLQNWAPNDNPMIEHARWFPHCAYARKLCGEELYRKIQESKRAHEEHARANESKNRTVRNDIPNTSAPSLPPTTNRRQLLIPDESTLSRLVAARLDLPISQRLLKQNFKLSIIKRCWEDQLRLKHDDFVSESDLYMACLILQRQIEHINGKKENIIIPSIAMKKIVDFDDDKEKLIKSEKSFKNWPNISPSPMEMIKARWCWTGRITPDCTSCLYCGIEYHDWNANDNPLDIHQRLSLFCPFARSSHRMYSSSVPTKPIPEVFTKEKIANAATEPNSKLIATSASYYSIPEHRQTSLNTFPGGLPRNAEEIIRSGLYCVGQSTKLRCYNCRRSFNNIHDCPSGEINVMHRYQSPNCSYARLLPTQSETTSANIGDLCRWCLTNSKEIAAYPSHQNFILYNDFICHWNMIRNTIYVFLIISVRSQTHIPIGWFVDEKTSNDADLNAFYDALSAAIILNDTTFSWPVDQFNFQSISDNVTDSNIYSSVHQICNRLGSGVIGSISSVDHSKTRLLDLFMTRLHVSMISLNYFNYNKQDLTSLNKLYHLTMKIDLLPVLVALIKRYKITKLFYIMEGDEAFERFQTLVVAQAREKSYDVLDIQGRQLIDITNSNNTGILLQSIEIKDRGSKEELYIVLDLNNISSYIKLLMQIRHHGMTTPHYHYILMSLDADRIDMGTFRYGGVNVTYFLPQSSFKMNISSDGSLTDRLSLASFEKKSLADALSLYMRAIMRLDRDIRSKIIHSGYEDNNFDHLKIDCRTKENHRSHEIFGEELFIIMKSLSFDGYSGHIAFNDYGERINYTLSIYQVTMNRLPRNIGNFTRDEFTLRDFRVFEGRQAHDFDKTRERIISTIIDEPFTMLNESAVGNLTASDAAGQYFTFDELYGYCVDLARLICENKLRIPCKFRIVKDNSFGNKPANDQPWTGMIGELVRREADLAVAPLTITSQRENVVDFSKPWMNLGISILISKPEKNKPGVFSFMTPLSKEIWMCVAFAYIGVSVILFLVSRFSPYEWSMKNQETMQLSNKFSILNTLFFALAAFMQQGVDFIPRSISGRLVAGVWWYFSMILVSSYTANLAAFLTVKRMVTPIESVEDLARQTEIKYGVVRGGSTQAFFEKSDVKLFQRMWTYMQQRDDVFVASNEEGISKVRKSKEYAFLLESTKNEYTNERSPCDTMKIGSNLDSKGYGIATPVGSELREAINIAILEMSEDGTMNNLKKKWWYDRSECHSDTTKDSKQNNALNLVNVAGIFYILIGGLALAILIAVLEFFVKANNEAKQTKNNFVDVMRRNMRLSIAGIPLGEAVAIKKISLKFPRQNNFPSSDPLFDENGHLPDNNHSHL